MGSDFYHVNVMRSGLALHEVVAPRDPEHRSGCPVSALQGHSVWTCYRRVECREDALRGPRQFWLALVHTPQPTRHALVPKILYRLRGRGPWLPSSHPTLRLRLRLHKPIQKTRRTLSRP